MARTAFLASLQITANMLELMLTKSQKWKPFKIKKTFFLVFPVLTMSKLASLRGGGREGRDKRRRRNFWYP